MTFSYYPGCTLSTKAKELDICGRRCAEALGVKLEEIENLGIQADVYDDYWTVSYKIDIDFIKRYYPDFEFENTEYISGNIYKCGDKTKIVHYLACFDVKCEKPDFHRPEYFGKIYLG